MTKIDKRKLVDWNKKSGNDSERIGKHLEERAELEDSATTRNDTRPKTLPPAAPKGAPLLKLRKKIREVYDDEDEDEDDEVNAPFFNISLMDDDEQEHSEERDEAARTMKITKQQQLAGKLNLAMATAATIESIGLSGKLTKDDMQMIHSASYDAPQVQRKLIEEKVEKPLGLKGKIPEDDLEAAFSAIKKVNKEMPADSLNGMPAKNVSELNTELDQEDIAKLILEKSGRKKSKKGLAEITKGINLYEQEQQIYQKDQKEKE